MTKSYKPLKLPRNDSELKKYISENKIILMEQILDSIEFGLDKKLPSVEVFSFKDTDFVVSIESDKFRENVENIYASYIEDEKYELCDRIKKINLRLNKHEK